MKMLRWKCEAVCSGCGARWKAELIGAAEFPGEDRMVFRLVPFFCPQCVRVAGYWTSPDLEKSGGEFSPLPSPRPTRSRAKKVT